MAGLATVAGLILTSIVLYLFTVRSSRVGMPVSEARLDLATTAAAGLTNAEPGVLGGDALSGSASRERKTVPSLDRLATTGQLSRPERTGPVRIEFWGQVVDQDGHPVEGAEAECSWTDDSEQGHSQKVVTTDSRGVFHLRGDAGYHLHVRVAKLGFLSSTNNRTGFFYTGEKPSFRPNPEQPERFLLFRKQGAEPLIRVGGAGLGGMKEFRLAKDGSPATVSLLDGQASPPRDGHLRVRCWTSSRDSQFGKYDWRCQIEIVGGELQEIKNEFGFRAPEHGYAAAWEFETGRTRADWAARLDRRFYYRLQDGRFGRFEIHINTIAEHFFAIESFLNPTGSRNLEYDPAVQPKPKVYE
jgi:hypothetical protein